jgi:bidirectional [NiFe] hydrogenase diaphorase subunit
VVCTGTACHINGSRAILDAIAAEWHVVPGQTTLDGRLSLLTARCVGTCSLAPVMLVDGAMKGRITPAGALARLAEL